MGMSVRRPGLSAWPVGTGPWALAERARRGEGSECREEFLGAYLRLYAPSLATEREGERWRIGPGPTRWTFQRSREGRVLRSPR